MTVAFYFNITPAKFDSEYFLNIGLTYVRRTAEIFHTNSLSLIAERRLIAFYGASHTVCEKLWLNINSLIPDNCQPSHLLWSLHFLKTYDNEMVRSALFRVDKKTMRKWQWIVISALAKLRLVRCFYFLFFSYFTND